MLMVKTAQKWDIWENISLLFYKANPSILRNEIVDLFYVFGRIQLLSKHY